MKKDVSIAYFEFSLLYAGNRFFLFCPLISHSFLHLASIAAGSESWGIYGERNEKEDKRDSASRLTVRDSTLENTKNNQ